MGRRRVLARIKLGDTVVDVYDENMVDLVKVLLQPQSGAGFSAEFLEEAKAKLRELKELKAEFEKLRKREERRQKCREELEELKKRVEALEKFAKELNQLVKELATQKTSSVSKGELEEVHDKLDHLAGQIAEVVLIKKDLENVTRAVKAVLENLLGTLVEKGVLADDQARNIAVPLARVK